MSQRSRSNASRNNNIDETLISNSQRRLVGRTTRNFNAHTSQLSSSQCSTSTFVSPHCSTMREDMDYQQSQGSQRNIASQLSAEEEQHLVSGVIKYLLIADQSKIPIQRANIIKAAMGDRSKFYKPIMSKVQSSLKQIFGYDLVALEGSKYIITNNLNNSNVYMNSSKRDKAEQVLLFIALAHIFMSNDCECEEGELFNLFRALKIVKDDNFKHEYFGDIQYLLTDKFVKQGHIKLISNENSENFFKWGARAENHISPRQILEFMSKIFGGRPLTFWPMQFKIMQMKENSNMSS